eukprot:m.91407 g.91407  ORF g.91407 m.91407 type:complete len:144 (+) comp36693_c0_seq3:22-453(+)
MSLPFVLARRVLSARAIDREVLLLYEHDRSRFFGLVGFASASQLIFWSYLSHFIFTEMRPWGKSKSNENSETLAPIKALKKYFSQRNNICLRLVESRLCSGISRCRRVSGGNWLALFTQECEKAGGSRKGRCKNNSSFLLWES